MPNTHTRPQRFRGTIAGSEKTRMYIALPFDPGAVWGEKTRHHVAGTIDGRQFRGVVEHWPAKGFVIRVGDGRGAPGASVDVLLAAEGPQRDTLAPDVAAALEADPDAGAFFDALATFYRKGYLRWIDATKRRPDVRAARIAEMVELLRAGRKER